jgi:hypothetical protein
MNREDEEQASQIQDHQISLDFPRKEGIAHDLEKQIKPGHSCFDQTYQRPNKSNLKDF